MKLAVLFCSVASLAAASPADTFSIAGSVVNALTGEPLRRASVGLQCQAGSPRQTMLSDAGGRFEFTGLSAAKCTVWAERRGFGRAEAAHDAGPVSGDLMLRLTPYGVITGKVVDENGDPVMGASIQVLQSQISMGQRAVRPQNSESTNDLGEYRVAQLPPGRYYVTAAVPAAMDDEITYARAYYAGATEYANATPIDIAPGGEQRVDFRLQPTHGYTIRGSVANIPRGFNGRITLAPRSAVDGFNDAGHPVQLNPESGEFSVRGVTPGHYILNTTVYQAGGVLAGSQEIAIGDGDLDGVVLVVSKGAEISGSVRLEEKEGARFDLQRVGIILRPKEFGFNPQPSARLKPDLTFLIPQIVPADYLLLVTVQDPYYVSSAVFGGIDATTGTLSITPGVDPPPLEIVIGSNGGEISGTVMQGDQPAPHSGVLVTRRGFVSAQDKTASTDSAGKFRISALPPGDYTAYAWPDVGAIEFRNPEVLQRYRGESVTVSEGGKQTVQLKLNTEP